MDAFSKITCIKISAISYREEEELLALFAVVLIMPSAEL
jgi:hypothetical protein